MQISPWIPLAATGLQAAGRAAAEVVESTGFLDLLQGIGIEPELATSDSPIGAMNSSKSEGPPANFSAADLIKKIAERLKAAGITDVGELEIQFSDSGKFHVNAASENSTDVTNVLHFDEQLRQQITNFLGGKAGTFARDSGGEWQFQAGE